MQRDLQGAVGAVDAGLDNAAAETVEAVSYSEAFRVIAGPGVVVPGPAVRHRAERRVVVDRSKGAKALQQLAIRLCAPRPTRICVYWRVSDEAAFTSQVNCPHWELHAAYGVVERRDVALRERAGQKCGGGAVARIG